MNEGGDPKTERRDRSGGDTGAGSDSQREQHHIFAAANIRAHKRAVKGQIGETQSTEAASDDVATGRGTGGGGEYLLREGHQCELRLPKGA